MSLTKYLKRTNYAFLLAEYEEQRLAYRDYEVPMHDVLLQLGYMQPLLSDKGRNIFTNLGLSALGAMRKSMGADVPSASSMVGQCIAPLSASSRIVCSSSSRLRDDCYWALICIAFVPPWPWDCALAYRTKKNNEKETCEYAVGYGATCRSEPLSPCL